MVKRDLVFKLTFIAGIFLFGYLIVRIGPSHIIENVKKLSALDLVILFFLRSVYWIIRTLIWKRVARYYGEAYSFSNLFSARIVGHAVSYLTPASYFGGEVFRAMAVSSRNNKKTLASVIVDKTIEIMAALIMTVIGVIVALSQVSFPAKIKYLSIALIVVFILLVFFVFIQQKKGFLSWIIQSLQKVRIKFSFIEGRMSKLRETDKYVSNYYKKNQRDFLRIFLLYFFLHFFWVFEIHLTIIFINGHDFSFLKSFLIVSLGTIVFFLPSIPASLGTYEAAYVGLFLLMGFSSDFGISVTLIRRILALFWAGYGLIIIGTKKKQPIKKSY
jgi:uncharacterized protein (TIRG00374 family)